MVSSNFLIVLVVLLCVQLTKSNAQSDSSNDETLTSVDSSTDSPRFILEDFVPLSKSHLWKLMMSFYDRKGPKSWTEGGVPNFVTSNSYIAKGYSKVLM